MKDLIIVESPTKAKTITKFLKGKYVVVASKGHVRDLPKSKLGVDVDNNFEPEYEIPERAVKNVIDLKQKAKGAQNIYLATDEDREGEAISYHIAWILSNNSKSKSKKVQHSAFSINNYKRIVFHEITQSAIENALSNPRTVNMNLVDAQQARRVLDRLVGYKLSPVLWKKIRFGLSAGRVQSVALRLIVEKERERDAFNIQDYFLIDGTFNINSSSVPATLDSINKKNLITKIKGEPVFLITTKDQADKHQAEIKTKNYSVSKVKQTEKSRKPYPPFTTSLLQQAAANIGGFTAQRTMRAAQKLYENGLITYHRTDSYNISSAFVPTVEKFIKKEFGAQYYQHNFFKTKSKGAQEAHEAIRPTNIKTLPSSIKLGRDETIVYELIFARTLAIFMPSIKMLMTRADITSNDNIYNFKATGQQVIFEGWNKAYTFCNLLKYSPLSEDTILPEIKEKDTAKLNETKVLAKQTTPPARYTEASLIKVLEQYGIGRPSTYAPTIATIQGRGYVEKDGRNLVPTDLGKIVVKLLEDNFEQVVDYGFTAEVEANLDKIAEGKEQWQKAVKDFYVPFIKQVEKADGNLQRNDYTVLSNAPANIKCPTCNGKMILKLGRAGKFYSCASFPTCKGIRDIDGKTEQEHAKKINTKEFQDTYKPAPKSKEGTPYLLKRGKFGDFWAHPDYPKVKDAKALEYKKTALTKMYGVAPKTKEGKNFVFRQGKFGPYWAHPNYPKVKETVRIKVEKEKANS